MSMSVQYQYCISFENLNGNLRTSAMSLCVNLITVPITVLPRSDTYIGLVNVSFVQKI